MESLQKANYCVICHRRFKNKKALTLHNRQVHHREVNDEPMVSSEPLSFVQPEPEVYKTPHADSASNSSYVITSESESDVSDTGSSKTTTNRHLRRQRSDEPVASTSSEPLIQPTSEVFKSPQPVPAGKQRCQYCGHYYVNLINHVICKPRKQSGDESQTDSDSTSTSIPNQKVIDSDFSSASVSSRESDSDVSSTGSSQKPRRRRTGRRKLIGQKRTKGKSYTKPAATTVSVDTSSSEMETENSETSEPDESDNGATPRVLRRRRIPPGSTTKQHLAVPLEEELKALNAELRRAEALLPKIGEDPLLKKLTDYHDKLLLLTDNVLTEKLSSEAEAVINNVGLIDDVGRPFAWSAADEARLNDLNVEVKRLKTPPQWRWAAKEGTPQYDYNHKRMQLCVLKEFAFRIINCPNCLSTGLLVGDDQIRSEYCHDCNMLTRMKAGKDKTDMIDGWNAVRPPTMEWPKRTEAGFETEDLPHLTPGEKSVLAPVQPIVTVRKTFYANKQYREESITLRQDPGPTWCKILPRTDLKDRFVVIQRVSKNRKERHIVADPEKVRQWLKYLFKNHSEFIRMREDGDLTMCEAALSALENNSELAEVHDDVEYTSDQEEELETQEDGVNQAALQAPTNSVDVFTFDNYPHLYITQKQFMRIRDQQLMEIIDDKQVRVPIYCVSARVAFPHLYPRGEKSPLDFGRHTVARYLLKKQTLFAHEMSDGKLRWNYAEDDIHMCHSFARLVEMHTNCKVGFYLTSRPDCANQPIANVIEAFKNGFTEDGAVLDSHLPGLSSIMAQLPNSRERWFAERLGIEAICRDMGSANVFWTLNMDTRSSYECRSLVYELEHGTKMPDDHPFEMNTTKFTELMSKYAAHLAIFLYRKTKVFVKAFLCDICGVPKKQVNGDWRTGDRKANGWYWGRVEFTETRGVPHYHILARLPGTMETELLGRLVQNGRVVRQEMKCGNIKPGMENDAWEIIEIGLLASRYCTLLADSLSMASFYSEHMDVDEHDPSKVLDLNKYRMEYVHNYKNGNISRETNPLMRRFDDEYCDPNPYVEMAKVASLSCQHHCLLAACGGDDKGNGCRFDFPHKLMPRTVVAVMSVNASQSEARVVLRRTADRVCSTNPLLLTYWRTNSDLQVLVDGAHKMRYATKYAAKSGKYTELLNEIIEYLSKTSMDVLPVNMKQTLSLLVLADCSHRAFLSKNELAYKVMDLPSVFRTFPEVGIVGFYNRATLTESAADGSTIVYSDRTDYSAYAERCCDKTVIVNRINGCDDKALTKDEVAAMNFRDFAETVKHEWKLDKAAAVPEEIGPATPRKYLNRNVDSGHWVLKRLNKRRHIRFSTVLYTEPAHLYQPVQIDEITSQTSFFALPLMQRRQLYRAYMELVCYVPWKDTPDDTFIVDPTLRALLDDTSEDPDSARYSLRRLEMFHQEYMKMWHAGLVAPPGSQWSRDNQFSYSMYLTTQHNADIHTERVQNAGCLKAQFDPADELKDTEIDIQPVIHDEVDESDFPSPLNFIAPDVFREVMDQPPPAVSDVSVAFPLQEKSQALVRLVMNDTTRYFMAKPPPSSVAYESMTFMQRKAVDLGIDPKHKILYISGRAGCGKTQVALKICELLKNRVQCAAGTGRASQNFCGPTVHAMFGWTYDFGDGHKLTDKQITELRVLYQDVDTFIFDESDANSAEFLADIDESMTVLFNPERRKNAQGDVIPFGNKCVVFLGDASQLPPVIGERQQFTSGYNVSSKVRLSRGVRQTRLHRAARGQELYRKYLAPNCIYLQKGQRNNGLLQQICDRLRNGEQTEDDLDKLTFQRRHFPDCITDYGIHYDNESCSSNNWKQLWNECKVSTPPKRLYVCRASYHTTRDNDSIVSALSSLPAPKFNFAADVLCVAEGCDVRLVKNLSVSAGLVNSCSGKVIKVIYNDADLQALVDGKNPPPYCIVVDFPGFQGFKSLDRPGVRIFPFPDMPQWVPIYRAKFTPMRRDLPSYIVKKQKPSECYREQFPLDLSRHITTHRAQGQTLRNCTVSVDLGLENPDRVVPEDIGQIIYVACTRCTQLSDLFVSLIHPSIWEKLGQSTADAELHVAEAKLKDCALNFASEHGFYREMKAELSLEEDDSNNDEEWKQLRNQKSPPTYSVPGNTLDISPGTDLVADVSGVAFDMCMMAVASERHIGIDQGRRNFAIVVVDKRIGHPPLLIAAENYDLQLAPNFKVTDAVLALCQQTDLMSWMQHNRHPKYPDVDRVIVHVEQMSVKNPNWKQFGIELGEDLQRRVPDAKKCVVKLSQPHIHRDSGPMFKIGNNIVADLSLVAASYGRSRVTKRPRGASRVPQASTPTRATHNVGTSESESDDSCATPVRQIHSMSIGTPKKPRTAKCRRVLIDDVEPSDSSDSDVDPLQDPAEYRRKKGMSARIFRYFVDADETSQENLGIDIDAELQDIWRRRIADSPRSLKLDDLGDALLHSLDAILSGGTNYRQLVPPTSSLQCNRTVIICVQQGTGYWAVVHSTWNLYVIENMGYYESAIDRTTSYRDPSTVGLIRKKMETELKTALTDMSGGNLYKPVEHIKMVVKQTTGCKGIMTPEEAGALTNATVSALSQICDESVGPNSQLCQKNDKVFGKLYIQSNIATGHKFQVVRSAGKQTSAMLSCMVWMMENAKRFVVDRTHSMNQSMRLKFFFSLMDLATSPENRFEMIEISPVTKQKLITEGWQMPEHTKKLLADLLLIGISKNEQHVKSVAAHYRKTTPRLAKVATNQQPGDILAQSGVTDQQAEPQPSTSAQAQVDVEGPLESD